MPWNLTSGWKYPDIFQKIELKTFSEIGQYGYRYHQKTQNFTIWVAISLKFRFFLYLYPYWPISGKKFSENFKWYILLISVVLSWWGEMLCIHAQRYWEGVGGANFLLKCQALCPICRTYLVVHIYTHIYVSIPNLCLHVTKPLWLFWRLYSHWVLNVHCITLHPFCMY